MNRISLILFVCLFSTNIIHSQSNQQNNIRPSFELKLAVNDSQFYSEEIKEGYYIINDSIIQIYPGEKIFIEASVVDNKLRNFKVVPKIKNKDKTLTIEFTQEKNGKIHEQMMLFIENPFKQDLYYSAMIYLMKYNEWGDTSVLPVKAGLSSYEMWPDIITTIGLIGFQLKE